MTNCGVCTATTDGFICRACLAQVEQVVGDMQSLLHELSIAATRQARVYRASGDAQRQQEDRADPEAHLPAFLRSPHGRTALRPTALPVNLEASEAMWVIGNTFSTWARHLAEQRDAEPPAAADLFPWLLRNVETVRWDEAAAAIHDEFTHVHRAAERAVDRSPSRLYAGPCHAVVDEVAIEQRGAAISPTVWHGRCERDLYAWPGAEEITCDGARGDREGCGAVHTLEGRAVWLLESVQGALLPLDLWRTALPKLFPELAWPNRSTWWRWERPDPTGRRGSRLAPVGQTRLGEPTYRGGDVLALVRSEQARIVGNLGKRRAS